ncbi:TrkA-N domain protein [Gracilinema caldarium DSM 7334]|uniref:TrkA-N domain protein n=2 Tax=Gracilinema caldarium TaxID=215591 RepID=F8F4H2_GRAC1|nr:TrkA-N domain protein [Gracilinema caldarium DSM 7334]
MVGTQLARHLINEKHDVSLIEIDEERARHASNRLDCLVINSEANNIQTLEEAGIAKADALICVTESDELNIIICGLAEGRYPQVLKIARVRNPDYDNLTRGGEKALGIDYFVHPDREAARTVVQAVEHGALGDILAFGDSAFEMGTIEIAKTSPLCGESIKIFHSLIGSEILVALIERGNEHILPSGTTTLHEGDRVYIIGRQADIQKVFEISGKKLEKVEKIGIVGGGRIGTLITEALLERAQPQSKSLFSFLTKFSPRRFKKIVLIEKDYELCKDLSVKFPDILVLNEDISDEGFISEEGIADLDLIITATDNQELNIITALYMKSHGLKRAIALVNSPSYGTIARRLGIDVVVPIKSVVVDTILARLMGSGVTGLHRLGEGTIEILEILVAPEAPVCGQKLKDFHLSSGGLVMLITRHGESFIPHGEHQFEPHDRLVIIAQKGVGNELERLFGRQE